MAESYNQLMKFFIIFLKSVIFLGPNNYLPVPVLVVTYYLDCLGLLFVNQPVSWWKFQLSLISCLISSSSIHLSIMEGQYSDKNSANICRCEKKWSRSAFSLEELVTLTYIHLKTMWKKLEAFSLQLWLPWDVGGIKNCVKEIV